jgi:hypothetical protein
VETESDLPAKTLQNEHEDLATTPTGGWEKPAPPVGVFTPFRIILAGHVESNLSS